MADEVDRLLECLLTPPSLLERLRGADPRLDCLKRLAAVGDFRVVPVLLPLFAANDSLSQDAARTIAALVSGINPAALAWIDEQARRYPYSHLYANDAWTRLSPAAVQRLCGVAAAYPAAVGLLASHHSGFVREAAVKELGTLTGGEEIPFLALRANDWVWSVAARAGELLARRLVPDNRAAVLIALPFIVRMLGQRRHDHGRFADALRTVLVSDGGRGVLTRMSGFEAPVRRFAYELIGREPMAADNAVMRGALADPDATVRRRAVNWLSATEDAAASATILEQMLGEDPVPVVRKEALTVLTERAPDRVRHLLPRVLLDPSARVRGLARFLVSNLSAGIVPRDVYIEAVKNRSSRDLAAAIDGVGETGTGGDVDLLIPFLNAASPRVRRAALRASAKLDVERGVPLAIAGLADAAPSVQSAALGLLEINAHRVDFGLVGSRVHGLDARVRQKVLSLFREAPKWEAAALLLEAVGDIDPEVRKKASRLLDSWLTDFNRSQAPPRADQLDRIHRLLDTNGSALPEETAGLLRFSLKSAGNAVRDGKTTGS